MIVESPSFPPPFLSNPKFSSPVALIGTSFINNNSTRPNPENPIIVFQITDMLSANATLTSVLRGSESWGIAGIAAYAISAPEGNWEVNEDGREVLS